jgi:hypothetical protein
MLDEIQAYAGRLGADVSEKKGVWSFSKIIAERKAFLSTKKLTYTAKFRIDAETKTLKFTEMLAEKGSGLSAGGGFDGDLDASPGFGFKKEVYKTGGGGREGSIAEQSNLFGKDYRYSFDYSEIRKTFEDLARTSGYQFKYQVTPLGL